MDIEAQERNRIPFATAGFMLAVAFGFDFLETLLAFLVIGLVLNPILITPLAWLTFWLWFTIRQVPFSGKMDRMGIMLIAGLIKDMPFADVLPGWTVSTWFIIRGAQKEDKRYNEEQAAAIQNTVNAQQQAEQAAIRNTRNQSLAGSTA